RQAEGRHGNGNEQDDASRLRRGGREGNGQADQSPGGQGKTGGGQASAVRDTAAHRDSPECDEPGAAEKSQRTPGERWEWIEQCEQRADRKPKGTKACRQRAAV